MFLWWEMLKIYSLGRFEIHRTLLSHVWYHTPLKLLPAGSGMLLCNQGLSAPADPSPFLGDWCLTMALGGIAGPRSSCVLVFWRTPCCFLKWLKQFASHLQLIGALFTVCSRPPWLQPFLHVGACSDICVGKRVTRTGMCRMHVHKHRWHVGQHFQSRLQPACTLCKNPLLWAAALADI